MLNKYPPISGYLHFALASKYPEGAARRIFTCQSKVEISGNGGILDCKYRLSIILEHSLKPILPFYSERQAHKINYNTKDYNNNKKIINISLSSPNMTSHDFCPPPSFCLLGTNWLFPARRWFQDCSVLDSCSSAVTRPSSNGETKRMLELENFIWPPPLDLKNHCVIIITINTSEYQ